MPKFYEVVVDGAKYRIASVNLAEATKKALNFHLDGKPEPKQVALTVAAREVPAVEKIG